MGYFVDAGNTSPHASPKVKYTDLKLDSDLTHGNGDNESGSGTTTMGLGMGWVIWVNLCLGRFQ